MSENININKLFDDTPEILEKEQKVTSVEDELDIPTVKVDVDIHYQKAISKGDKEDYEDDMAYARNTLLKSLGSADKILESLMKKIVANDQISVDDDTSPKIQVKYYEISTILVKSICDASKELINLHVANSKVKHDNPWVEQVENKQNNTMTTNELLKHIKEMNKA